MHESIEKQVEDTLSKNDERYLVPGLIRGLAILEAFNRESTEMTITEIAEILEVNRSSAFRLIYTLESSGYLRKTTSKTYSLDSKVMELGFNSISKLSLVDIAMPAMKALRDHSQFAVHLSTLEGTYIVYIGNVQSTGSFSSNLRLGTRWPAHATVIGQLMLADLPIDEVKQRYSQFNQWVAFSERTPANLEQLLTRLDEVRTQKAMVSWGHYNHDMAACASPIYRQVDQKIIAVLSVSCPISTYSETFFKTEIMAQVIQTADKISKFTY